MLNHLNKLKEIDLQNSPLCILPAREEIYDIDSITLEEHYRIIQLGLDFLLQKSSLNVEFIQPELLWQKKALKIIDIIQVELKERTAIEQFGSQIVSLKAEEEFFNKLNDYSSFSNQISGKELVENHNNQQNNNSDFNKMEQQYFFTERLGEKIQKNQEENKQNIIDHLKKKCFAPIPELSCVHEKTEDIEEKSALQDGNSFSKLKIQKMAEYQKDEGVIQKCYTTSSNMQRFDTQSSDFGLDISKIDEPLSLSFSHQFINPIRQATHSTEFQQQPIKNNQSCQQNSRFNLLKFQTVTTDFRKQFQNSPLSSPKFQKLGEKLNNRHIYDFFKKTLQKTRIEQALKKSTNLSSKQPSDHLHEHILNPFGKYPQQNYPENNQYNDISRKKLQTNITNNFQKANMIKSNSSFLRKCNENFIKQKQSQKLQPISTSLTQFQFIPDSCMDIQPQTVYKIQASQNKFLLSQSPIQNQSNNMAQHQFSTCTTQCQSYNTTSSNFFNSNSNNNITSYNFNCSNQFHQINSQMSESEKNIQIQDNNNKANSVQQLSNSSNIPLIDEISHINEQNSLFQKQNLPYIKYVFSTPSGYNIKIQQRYEKDIQNKQNSQSSTKGDKDYIEIQKNLKKQILPIKDQICSSSSLTSPRLQRIQNKSHKSNSITFSVHQQQQPKDQQQQSHNHILKDQNKENVKNEVSSINKFIQNIQLNNQQKLKRSFSSQKKSDKQKFILDQRQNGTPQNNQRLFTYKKNFTNKASISYNQCQLMSKSQVLIGQQPNHMILQNAENDKDRHQKQQIFNNSRINEQNYTLSINNESNNNQNSFQDIIKQEIQIISEQPISQLNSDRNKDQNSQNKYQIQNIFNKQKENNISISDQKFRIFHKSNQQLSQPSTQKETKNTDKKVIQEIQKCSSEQDDKQNLQEITNKQIFLQKNLTQKQEDNSSIQTQFYYQNNNNHVTDLFQQNQSQKLQMTQNIDLITNESIQDQGYLTSQNQNLQQAIKSINYSDYSNIDQSLIQKPQYHIQLQNQQISEDQQKQENEEQQQTKQNGEQNTSNYEDLFEKYKQLEQNKPAVQNFKSYSTAVIPIQRQQLFNDQFNFHCLESQSNFFEESTPSKEENNLNEYRTNKEVQNNNLQVKDINSSFYSVNNNRNSISDNITRQKSNKRVQAPNFQPNQSQKQIEKIQQSIGKDEDLIDYTDIIPSFECLFSGFYSNMNYQSANHTEFNLLQLMLEIYEIFSDHVSKVDKINIKNQNGQLKKFKLSLNEQSPTDIIINQNPQTLFQYQSKIDINIPRFIDRCFIQQFNNSQSSTNPHKNQQNNLKQEDYFIQPYFRVIKNKTEVFEIVNKSFFRKSKWNELPHALNLKTSWNLLWTWAKPQIDFKKLFYFQKVNHFPENKNMSRKDLLLKNLRNAMKLGKNTAKEFDIMPQTYLLPKEYASFYLQFQQDQLEEKEKNIWILKPISQSRGNGIFLINDLTKVVCNEQMVAQKYLQNPLLIKGFKFDMRIYVLVTSFKPLEAFIYKEGFARMSTKPFSLDQDQIENKFIHLTNYAIQKMNQDQQNSESSIGGSKITLKMLSQQLEQLGIKWSNIWKQVEDIVLKSLIACQNEIQNNPNCFEIFGYDIIIDSNKKCWLLEINSSPSLARDYIIDDIIKQQLIDDAIDLIDPKQFDRQRLVEVLERRIREEQGQKSTLHTQNHSKLQLNRDLNYILRKQKIRKVGETPQFMGDFKQISPSENSNRLQKLVQSYKKEQNIFQSQKFQSMKQKIFLNKIHSLKELQQY